MRKKMFRCFSLCLPLAVALGMMLELNEYTLALAQPSSSTALLVPYGFESQFGRPSLWDSPNSFEEIMPDLADQPRSSSSSDQYLNWQDWNSLYQEGGDLCRESNGNIICLTPESAGYLRW